MPQQDLEILLLLMRYFQTFGDGHVFYADVENWSGPIVSMQNAVRNPVQIFGYCSQNRAKSSKHFAGC